MKTAVVMVAVEEQEQNEEDVLLVVLMEAWEVLVGGRVLHGVPNVSWNRAWISAGTISEAGSAREKTSQVVGRNRRMKEGGEGCGRIKKNKSIEMIEEWRMR